MSDALIGVIVGGLLTAIPTLITFWIGKRSDERRHLRELAFHAALENWKSANDWAEKRQGGSVIEPLDVFLLHMLKLSEVAARPGLTANNVGERMREVQAIVRQASQQSNTFTTENHPERAQ